MSDSPTRFAITAAVRVEQIGNATLYLGDCRLVLPMLPQGNGVTVITDPPYGMGPVVSARGDNLDRVSNTALASWDEEFDPASVPWPSQNIVAFTLDWRVPEWYRLFGTGRLLAWNKTNPTPSIRKQMINSAEWIFSTVPMTYRAFSNSQAVLRGPFDTSPARPHPCKKPDWLMRELVEMFAPIDVLVVDPFMGSGTTGVACARLGRSFVGIESDPIHFETSVRKISESQRQGDLFV